MGIRFTADDLLVIAEQIERNGVAFYAAAAEAVAGSDTAAILAQLSAWEATHAELFATMRHELSPRERETSTYDPDDEIALYLQAMADGQVFLAQEDPAAILGPSPSPVRILALALEREQSSIVFYTGLRAYLPASHGGERLDAVIREEYGHIALLQRQQPLVTQ